MSQYSLSVLCHCVALADCIRPGYVGGQFVITRNILSFSFLHNNNNNIVAQILKDASRGFIILESFAGNLPTLRRALHFTQID